MDRDSAGYSGLSIPITPATCCIVRSRWTSTARFASIGQHKSFHLSPRREEKKKDFYYPLRRVEGEGEENLIFILETFSTL